MGLLRKTHARARPSVLALALAFALCGGGAAVAQTKGSAKGKPKAADAPAAPPVMDPKAAKVVVEKLASQEATQVLEGLTLAAAAGPAAAPVVSSIEALLDRGATTGIARSAIEALGAIGAASSSAALRPYLRHRVPELRRAAARALATTRGAEAAAAFKDGLRSADAQVRGFSATGLGNLGAADALPELFLALDHNVSEAAASIGQLCSGATCDALVGKLGTLPLDVMTSGIDPILFRASPLPEEALIKIIGELRELGTPEAGKYLTEVLNRWPASGSKRVKQLLESAVSSLPGASK